MLSARTLSPAWGAALPPPRPLPRPALLPVSTCFPLFYGMNFSWEKSFLTQFVKNLWFAHSDLHREILVRSAGGSLVVSIAAGVEIIEIIISNPAAGGRSSKNVRWPCRCHITAQCQGPENKPPVYPVCQPSALGWRGQHWLVTSPDLGWFTACAEAGRKKWIIHRVLCNCGFSFLLCYFMS